MEFKKIPYLSQVLCATYILNHKQEEATIERIREMIEKLNPEITEDEFRKGLQHAYDWGLIRRRSSEKGNEFHLDIPPEYRGSVEKMLRSLGYLKEELELPIEL